MPSGFNSLCSSLPGIKNGANGSDVLGFRAVDKFEFTDGTSITYAELVARGFDIVGTLFDDQLFGTNVVDRITGGAGNDQLEGGAGDDTFFFNQGDGLDNLTDQATSVCRTQRRTHNRDALRERASTH